MLSLPKTIQIFLPNGDPHGIRVVEITTRIVQVIEVPRSLLTDFLKLPESRQVALYFLFGEGEKAQTQKFTSDRLETYTHGSSLTTKRKRSGKRLSC